MLFHIENWQKFRLACRLPVWKCTQILGGAAHKGNCVAVLSNVCVSVLYALRNIGPWHNSELVEIMPVYTAQIILHEQASASFQKGR